MSTLRDRQAVKLDEPSEQEIEDLRSIGEEDPLAPARGMVNGVILGGLIWVVILAPIFIL